MFNLQKQSESNDADLLAKEILIFRINPESNGYKIGVGDECLHLHSLDDCLEHISEGIDELRSELWEIWKKFANLCGYILENQDRNQGSLDNLVFLNSAKKAFLLSNNFSDLKDISLLLRHILDADISYIGTQSVSGFNKLYLQIRLIHHLIMTEKYRSVLIKKYKQLNKKAQISGPWANLDLPMQERMWPYSEDESYFEDRKKARRDQTRYNPETDKQGFFYTWVDKNRDPYLFTDMQKDSPYKSRLLMTIP